MKKLPFKMRKETEMEKYRAKTFWTKEPETIEWIKSFKKDDTFVDVGANVGVYSLYAKSLYPKMVIFAFEPMEENFNSLWENITMNLTADNMPIFAFQYAVGSKQGKVKFNAVSKLAGESGGQVSNTGKNIRMITIDAILHNHLIRHIKIDIDGQELEVIKGMKDTLHYLKSVLVEVSKESKDEIIKILTSAGFTTENIFNTMTPHSRERRAKEGIDAENIIFTRC
jgi:FkbM family methyltransferase